MPESDHSSEAAGRENQEEASGRHPGSMWKVRRETRRCQGRPEGTGKHS